MSTFSAMCHVLTQDAKNNVDADLVMLEELKVKCRTQTEQIMAWKKAYSMQVIESDLTSRDAKQPKSPKWSTKKSDREQNGRREKSIP
jgi:hypothetical protein